MAIRTKLAFVLICAHPDGHQDGVPLRNDCPTLQLTTAVKSLSAAVHVRI